MVTRLTISFSSISLAIFVLSSQRGEALEFNDTPRYTWFLPKTVLDATVAYAIKECNTNTKEVQFNITPSLTPRYVPDLRIGQQSIKLDELQSALVNKNISITTYGSSGILNSIGSEPADQTAQIGGSVIGGISKLVGIALGTAALSDFEKVQIPGVTLPTCQALDKADACQKARCIADLKTQISSNDVAIAGGLDEAAQKKDTAANQAAQSVITDLQADLSFTIKTTIDPGLSPIKINPAKEDEASIETIKSYNAVADDRAETGNVELDGLAAAFCPSEEQLKHIGVLKDEKNHDIGWIRDEKKIKAIEENGVCSQEGLPELAVNVYLDFDGAQSSIYRKSPPKKRFEQTELIRKEKEEPKTIQLYRDPAVIPVEIWRGTKKLDDLEDKDRVTKLLSPPANVSFGQFGVGQALPLDAGLGQNIQWSVTFLESGQVSSAKFSAAATASAVANLFGTATSAASSIATEKRNADTQANTQEETLAAHSQADADAIYQAARDAACQAKPSACTQK